MRYNHILLIDDDDDDQEIFLTALEKVTDQIKCTAMNNASEALKQLVKKEFSPDVIFLDLNMPLMNGQQFLLEIKKKENLKHIPVIIFSTSSQQSAINTTKEFGAEDFITKPDKFNDLVAILKTKLL
jgi:CheY-like chemotaxis protein